MSSAIALGRVPYMCIFSHFNILIEMQSYFALIVVTICSYVHNNKYEICQICNNFLSCFLLVTRVYVVADAFGALSVVGGWACRELFLCEQFKTAKKH